MKDKGNPAAAVLPLCAGGLGAVGADRLPGDRPGGQAEPGGAVGGAGVWVLSPRGAWAAGPGGRASRGASVLALNGFPAALGVRDHQRSTPDSPGLRGPETQGRAGERGHPPVHAGAGWFRKSASQERPRQGGGGWGRLALPAGGQTGPGLIAPLAGSPLSALQCCPRGRPSVLSRETDSCGNLSWEQGGVQISFHSQSPFLRWKSGWWELTPLVWSTRKHAEHKRQ